MKGVFLAGRGERGEVSEKGDKGDNRMSPYGDT